MSLRDIMPSPIHDYVSIVHCACIFTVLCHRVWGRVVPGGSCQTLSTGGGQGTWGRATEYQEGTLGDVS